MKKIFIFITFLGLFTLFTCTGCNKMKSYSSYEKETIKISTMENDSFKDIFSIEIPKDSSIKNADAPGSTQEYNTTGKNNLTIDELNKLIKKNKVGPSFLTYNLYNKKNELLIAVRATKTLDKGNLKKSTTINNKKLYDGKDYSISTRLLGRYILTDNYSVEIVISYMDKKKIKEEAINDKNIELLKEIVETIKSVN